MARNRFALVDRLRSGRVCIFDLRWLIDFDRDVFVYSISAGIDVRFTAQSLLC
jgi:hypothetical protein